MIKDEFESFIYCVAAVVACVILFAVLILIKKSLYFRIGKMYEDSKRRTGKL